MVHINAMCGKRERFLYCAADGIRSYQLFLKQFRWVNGNVGLPAA
jgi:hypothetical protein